MSVVEINFSLAPWTFQLGDVFVWRVDPTSKQENLLGSFQQSSVTITQYASTFINQVQYMSKNQLRTIFEKVTSGEILSGFVASFICTIALMEIISESMMLADKIKLRGELVAKLEKQQSDPLPDPRNLFYYDGEWREGTGRVQRVVADDYQPTDPVELERLMGSREAYRAFLLATL